MKMSLIAVSESIEIKKLWDSFKKSLQQNALRYQRNVGWHGGNIATDVYWLPDQGFWVAFNHDPKSNREWSAFGTMDPSNSKVLSITCEVNIPFQGVNRQIAGVFVRDTDSGKIFIAHSGKIGGGQKGIGKKLFWRLVILREFRRIRISCNLISRRPLVSQFLMASLSN